MTGKIVSRISTYSNVNAQVDMFGKVDNIL